MGVVITHLLFLLHLSVLNFLTLKSLVSNTSCLICGHRLQAMFSTFCLSKYGKMLTYSLYK
nr:MAG TPA: hypothetical protein [Caudoviricetes sp.]DAQ08248.1 MAG TPA: hypothetical protein [Caudoviricetes sp.]DAQ87372.1 MAG TPA: hypothetical protein [Caudoviricetes sp.]DAW54321.1 MAG TPA: hypothetical protein [Caudoviricetes sp.]